MLEKLSSHLPSNRDKQRVALIDGDIIKYRTGYASQTTLYYLYLQEEIEGSDFNIRIPLVFEGKTALNKFMEKYNLDPAFQYWEQKIVPDSVDKCLHSVKLTLERIQNVLQTERLFIYLSGKGNFREDIATILPYKGNRKDVVKPYHYQAIHDYLVNVWGARVIEGMEADDALGIAQWANVERFKKVAEKKKIQHLDFFLKKNCTTTIVTLDKDLDMIPGWHYDWTKTDPSGANLGKLYWIGEDKALKNFFTQVITGDSTDNIPGIRGIGPAKAKKALEGLDEPQEMYDAAFGLYYDWVKKWKEQPEDVHNEAKRRMVECASLVWILRTPYNDTYGGESSPEKPCPFQNILTGQQQDSLASSDQP